MLKIKTQAAVKIVNLMEEPFPATDVPLFDPPPASFTCNIRITIRTMLLVVNLFFVTENQFKINEVRINSRAFGYICLPEFGVEPGEPDGEAARISKIYILK